MGNPDALQMLAHDLDDIFGARLEAVVSYAHADRTAPTSTLALVNELTADDLVACAARVGSWHKQRLATPLFVSAQEFARALDAFPYEFGAIIDDHTVIVGRDPFAGLRVDPADLRRACEIQARSHLLHLREAFVETANKPAAVAALIQRSAEPLAALLRNLTRLDAAALPDPVLMRVAHLEPKTLAAADAQRMMPDYIRAMERLTAAIDRWGAV